MKKRTNIISALKDKRLFGSLFPDLSTLVGVAGVPEGVLRHRDGRGQLELFRQCTGRAAPPQGGAKEAWAIVARRGGKSRIISTAGTYIGCFHDFRKYLAPGERGMVLNLARVRDQGKIVFNYISAIIESIPALKAMVIAWRQDEIELYNGITIAVKTSDYRAIRGTTIVCCICDEIAFWDAIGANPDTAVLQAICPAMSTVAESKLLVISSPYAKYGALHEAYRRYYGQDDPNILV